MAEFVESNIQATIQEVEELERMKLLDKKEVKALLEKRRELEYRVTRRYKDKEDFINAINYERKLIELLWVRRRRLKKFEKKKEIETAISSRVMKRCRFMTRYWPHHRDTWALRIDCASSFGWKPEVTIAYGEQIHYHGQDESLYVSWAKFEIEERQDFDTARKILLSKASLYHSKSLVIRREHFRLELLFVEWLKKKQKEDKALTEVIEENREKVLSCEIPRAVYMDAAESIPSSQLCLEFYQIASKFTFAEELREEIYRNLCETFPDSECVWKLRAQRIVMGLEAEQSEEEGEASKKLTANEKLESTISVYDKALEDIGPSFFSSYVDELMLMLHESWSLTKMVEVIVKKLLALFKSNESSLLPYHYIIWLNIIQRKPKSDDLAEEVMKTALKAFPDLHPIQLEIFRHMLKKGEISLDNKIKKFKMAVKSLKGAFGIRMFEEMMGRIKDRKMLIGIYELGCNHSDDTISREMRIRYLDWINEHRPIKRSRLMYEKYYMLPPFSGKFVGTMILGELKKKQGSMENARVVFELALLHSGKTQPGVWIAYIYFEKFAGNPLKAGTLYTRAESELKGEHSKVFRELHLMVVERLSNNKEKKSSDKSASEGTIWVTGVDTQEESVDCSNSAVRLFEEEPIITFSQDTERKEFFTAINSMKKDHEKGNQPISKENGSEWEEVLEFLIGEKIPLTLQQVELTKKIPSEKKKKKAKKNEQTYELTDHLDPGTKDVETPSGKKSLDKILETSLTLKPEFMKKTQLEPYFIGKEKAKAERRKERELTKGAGWYDMKAPEMTPELKRDMEVLQMRSVLDPKRPFKNKDLEVMPKYFQIGKIQDSALDFHSSRIVKKKRKRTIAEEIIYDEDTLRYQKQKYNEIIAKKQNMNSRSREGKKVKKMKAGSS